MTGLESFSPHRSASTICRAPDGWIGIWLRRHRFERGLGSGHSKSGTMLMPDGHGERATFGTAAGGRGSSARRIPSMRSRDEEPVR
jgi:hypothetical protein